MLVDRDRLLPRRGLAMVINADRFGRPAEQDRKCRSLRRPRGSFLHQGFKLFHQEDTDLMGPRQVSAFARLRS